MKITELMKIEDLEQAIENGLVSKRKHPTHPLYILNYTAVTQFDWNWNDVTLNCRGLVIDEDYNIVARSFPKFFSYEQLDGKLPQGNFVVEEKLDGSMLIAFNYNGELITATRGSFESEQAIKGFEFLKDSLCPEIGQTWIFEIIYKENRIVVDYDFEGVVLLSIIGKDGIEFSHSYLRSWCEILEEVLDNWKLPKVYSFNSLDEILNCNDSNIEGFVLRYDTGERVKIKTDDYKRLHRLITGVSEKTVWEALRDNRLEEMLENVPDEFYGWVKQVELQLRKKYKEIYNSTVKIYNCLDWATDRKEFALEAVKSKYPQLLFRWFDGKEVDDLIWKLVKPEVTTVYKMVREDSN